MHSHRKTIPGLIIGKDKDNVGLGLGSHESGGAHERSNECFEMCSNHRFLLESDFTVGFVMIGV